MHMHGAKALLTWAARFHFDMLAILAAVKRYMHADRLKMPRHDWSLTYHANVRCSADAAALPRETTQHHCLHLCIYWECSLCPATCLLHCARHGCSQHTQLLAKSSGMYGVCQYMQCICLLQSHICLMALWVLKGQTCSCQKLSSSSGLARAPQSCTSTSEFSPSLEAGSST